MTLGGLALAVGILVDDATVEIENIHRNLGMGKPMTRAILDGAHQVAVPAFVSTLCICIVFVPVFFLGGTAKFLFQPLAMGVIFAMLASYFLSRTVVPTMARFLLRHHLDEIETPDGHKPEGSLENPRQQSRFAGVFGWLRGIHDRFNHGFGKLVLLDPVETADGAVQEPADLGEAPGYTRDLPAQPLAEGVTHLLGQAVAEDVRGLGELGQLHARALQLRLEQRRVEPARAGFLDTPSGPLQGVGAVLVHSVGKATLAVG